jgi:hypothetical protein
MRFLYGGTHLFFPLFDIPRVKFQPFYRLSFGLF